MKRIWITQTIVILMLLWGLQRGTPYEYYTLLRWVCCISFLYVATRAWNLSRRTWTAIFVITAIIYNPPLRFYATRDTNHHDLMGDVMTFTAITFKGGFSSHRPIYSLPTMTSLTENHQ